LSNAQKFKKQEAGDRMNDQVIEKLKEIINKHGREICEDSKKFSGLLKDHCAEFKQETRLLINSIEQKTPQKLITRDETSPIELIIKILIKEFQEDQMVIESAANWCVQAWAVALGIISRPVAELKTPSAGIDKPRRGAEIDKTAVAEKINFVKIEPGIPYILKDGSFEIYEEIVVPEGCEIIIENAELKFNVNCGITCKGTLKASNSTFNAINAKKGWCNLYMYGKEGNTQLNIIKNCEFTNGKGRNVVYSTGSFISGGAIGCYDSNINITNCQFYACESFWGGAIIVQKGEIEINECEFENCKSDIGGALLINKTLKSQINKCRAEYCSAENGGAFYITRTQALIKDCEFNNCSADKKGGAIYSFESGLSIITSSFISCVGSAMYFEKSKPVITQCKFRSCTNDTEGGGAISCSNKSFLLLISCDFSNCCLSSKNLFNGGALFITDSQLSIIGSKFYKCNCVTTGGAAYFSGSSKINVTNCEFEYCNSTNGGAAIYSSESETNILESKFIECSNTSVYIAKSKCSISRSNFLNCCSNDNSYGGGAIHSTESHPIISECEFSVCTSNKGGAISNINSNPVITKCKFIECKSEKGGGAINFNNSSPEISFSKFIGCTGDKFGVLFFQNNSCALIQHSEFEMCLGTAIFVTESSIEVMFSKFNECRAESSQLGGAIRGIRAKAVINSSEFFKCSAIGNVQTEAGGAIYFTDSDFSIFKCNFEECSSTTGGAVYSEKSTSSILTSNFLKCSSLVSGGAIFFDMNNSALVQDCKIEKCNKSAIYICDNGKRSYEEDVKSGKKTTQVTKYKAVIIMTTHFIECRAENGSGINSDNSFPEIYSCVFDKCESTDERGGAIWSNNSLTIINDCNFSGCVPNDTSFTIS